jgi:hypothetical protein
MVIQGFQTEFAALIIIINNKFLIEFNFRCFSVIFFYWLIKHKLNIHNIFFWYIINKLKYFIKINKYNEDL